MGFSWFLLSFEVSQVTFRHEPELHYFLEFRETDEEQQARRNQELLSENHRKIAAQMSDCFQGLKALWKPSSGHTVQ